jgi:hypothetical protein
VADREDIRDRLLDAYRESMESPAKAEFGTGVHPDQFESYPLRRTSAGSYAADIETLDTGDEDVLLVDPESMEAYTNHENPSPEHFENRSIQYSISISKSRDGRPVGAPLQRSGEMRFEPIDPVEVNGEEVEVLSKLIAGEPLEHDAEDLYLTFKHRPLHVQITAEDGRTNENTITDIDPNWKNEEVDPEQLLEKEETEDIL